MLKFIHSYTILKWEGKTAFSASVLSGRVDTEKKILFPTKPQHHQQSRTFWSTCAGLCALAVGGRQKKNIKWQCRSCAKRPPRSQWRQRSRCSIETATSEPRNTALEHQCRNISLRVLLHRSISDMLSYPAAAVVDPAVCRPALNCSAQRTDLSPDVPTCP